MKDILLILKIENVSKIYQAKNGEITAVKNISLEVYKGEILSIIGPSGCGKSTILSIIALVTFLLLAFFFINCSINILKYTVCRGIIKKI